MKMKIKLAFVAILALMVAMPTVAQNKHPRAKKKAIAKKRAVTAHKVNMAQAINVMKRTNKVIFVAHKAVKKNKNYTGHLSRAIRHQRYAKALLKRNRAHRAVLHSRLARKYAFVAIRNNKGKADRSLEFSADENKLAGNDNVSDADLEKELGVDDPKTAYDDSKITDGELTELEVLDMDPADYKNQ